MSQKDYYQILGVARDADKNEIKRAFKRLAREYHPDVAEDKTAAEIKFGEINEAYSILSDDEKKAIRANKHVKAKVLEIKARKAAAAAASDTESLADLFKAA